MKMMMRPRLIGSLALTIIVALFFTFRAQAQQDLSPNYTWQPVKIGAGGWMRGMAVSASDATRRYARGDVGQLYAWNQSLQSWVPTQTVTAMPSSVTAAPTQGGAGAIAVDAKNPDHVIVAYALGGSSDVGNYFGLNIYSSTNGGTTFTAGNLSLNGNLSQETTGERLALDPNNGNIGYFGSPGTVPAAANSGVVDTADGLFRSLDGGVTWNLVTGGGLPASTATTRYEIQHPRFDATSQTVPANGQNSTKIVYVSYIIHDETKESNNNQVTGVSGAGLVKSSDGGLTWSNVALPCTPNATSGNFCDFYFSTIDQNGNLWVALDDGTSSLHELSRSGSWTTRSSSNLHGGYSGIAIDPTNALRVFALSGTGLSRSLDGGNTWTDLGSQANWSTDQTIQWLNPAPWRPQGHGQSTTGMYFDATGTNLYINGGNDGINVIHPNDGSDSASNPPVWTSVSEGIEELVGENVTIPPGGYPIVAVEDEASFTIQDPTQYNALHNTINTWGNYFGLASSQDVAYAPNQPQFVVLPAANVETYPYPWSTPYWFEGYSTNGGLTWTEFPSITNGTQPCPLEAGLMAVSARAVGHIDDPAGGDNIVWVGDSALSYQRYPSVPYYSTDGGSTWTPTHSFDSAGGISNDWCNNGTPMQSLPWNWGPWNYALTQHMLIADPVTVGTFYFNIVEGGFWISTDGGKTWNQNMALTNALPNYAHWGQMYAVPGVSGDLWFAPGHEGSTDHGLFHINVSSSTVTRNPNFDNAWEVALGKAAGQTYPTIYVYGLLHGDPKWGVFQSIDGGSTFNRIAYYPASLIDIPHSMAASWDTFGLVYISFGGNSLVYGSMSGGTGGTTAPGPPSLTVTPGNDENVLTFTPGSGGAPTSYNVYRGTTSGGETLLTGGYAGGTSYTDYSLTNGMKYYYYITATNSAGTSSQSTEVAGTPSSGSGGSCSIPSGTTSVFGCAVSGANAGDTVGYELGMQFISSQAGQITGLRVFRPTNNGQATYIATLWSSTGSKLATVTINAPTPNAWAETNLSSPYTIAANTTYVVSYTVNAGNDYQGLNNGLYNAITSGDLTTIAGSTSSTDGNGVYNTPGSFPNQSYQSFNYYADVYFVPNSGAGSSQVQVNLTPSVNVAAIYPDGTTFSSAYGLDGIGDAYSSNLLGSTLTYSGVTYKYGLVGAYDAVGGSEAPTISLPAGNYGALNFLATGFDGNQPSQVFTVTYSDGTTANFTRSLSDWYTPQGYSGEATAIATAYRNTSSGTEQTGPFNIYQYSLMLNSAKTISSVTLPNNAHIAVLAITLSGGASASSPTFVPGTYYQIQGQSASVDVNDYQFGTVNPNSLNAYCASCPVTNNEDFTVTTNNDGSFTFIEVAGLGLAIGVGGATSGGSAIDVETANGSTGQSWVITSTTGGNYKIINELSGLAMDVSANGSGANMVQNTYTGSATQQWTFLDPPNPTEGTLPTPTFSVAAGTYSTAQSVAITDRSGSTIYYTINGSTPSTSSTKYISAVTVSATETLKAIAVEANFNQSAIASATYTISASKTAATPTFSVVAGTYTTKQSVTLASMTSGAAIYYTLDGSAPTTSSAKYSAAISIAYTQTIKAIAVASGYTNSAVGTAAYVIDESIFAAGMSGGQANDKTPVYELGMKFKSAVAGKIVALRVYRPSASGLSSYQATLWSSTGSLLARVTISAPTAGAWATGTLSTPYSITAGTTYVVSYSKPANYDYQFLSQGLASVVTNSDLSTISGSNGVYASSIGTFPTNSFNSSNYYADILFTR